MSHFAHTRTVWIIYESHPPRNMSTYYNVIVIAALGDRNQGFYQFSKINPWLGVSHWWFRGSGNCSPTFFQNISEIFLILLLLLLNALNLKKRLFSPELKCFTKEWQVVRMGLKFDLSFVFWTVFRMAGSDLRKSDHLGRRFRRFDLKHYTCRIDFVLHAFMRLIDGHWLNLSLRGNRFSGHFTNVFELKYLITMNCIY